MKQVILRHRADMAPASPHGRLSSLHVPVLLLHGTADNVIPPSELLWLQNDVPPRYLTNALISPAISHVSMEGEPSLVDKFRLVHFMAQTLDLTEQHESVSHGTTSPTWLVLSSWNLLPGLRYGLPTVYLYAPKLMQC